METSELTGRLVRRLSAGGLRLTQDGEDTAARVLVERIMAAEELISWARAQQMADLARLAQLPVAPSHTGPIPGAADVTGYEAAEAEIGTALRLSRHAASRRLGDALTLSELPEFIGMLQMGLVDEGRALAVGRAMREHLPGAGSADPRWAAIEQTVAARAPERTASELRSDVRRAVMAIDPALAQLRREQAIKDREVRVYARPDGMADLDAHLTAESAQIITTALDLMAEAAQSAATHAADGRTHQERRADALTSIFAAILDGRPLPMYPAAKPSVGPSAASMGSVAVPAWWETPALPRKQRRRPHLVITVQAETLLGCNDLPAELTGYGAITAGAARDLAKHAGTADLIIIEPHSSDSDEKPAIKMQRGFGTPPQKGYRPSNPLVRQVLATHKTCRFPTCRRPAEQCDLDHLVAYSQGGATTAANLVPLCRHHHKLKTHAGWRLHKAHDHHPTGTLQWTSPAGLTYLVPPDDQPGSEQPS
jgi:hypothetical protein